MADETMPAEWRACKRFPGYEVSSDGQVRKDGRLRKRQVHPFGYTLVYITAKPKQLKVYVHALVCEAFHGERPPGHEVDHINRDQTDNRASNLRWLPASENKRRPRKTGGVARTLQGVGKRVVANLDVDGRRRPVDSVGNPAKPLQGISMPCGQICSQDQVTAYDTLGKDSNAPQYIEPLSDF